MSSKSMETELKPLKNKILKEKMYDAKDYLSERANLKESTNNNRDKTNEYLNYDLGKLTSKEVIIVNQRCLTVVQGTLLRKNYKFYKCPNHDDPEFLICSVCAVECHSIDINSRKTKEYERNGNFICSCAKTQHEKCQINAENIEIKESRCKCHQFFPDFCNYYFDIEQFESEQETHTHSNHHPEEEEKKISRKCLLCFLSNFEECLDENNGDIEVAYNLLVKKVYSKEEIDKIPLDERCECQSHHHKFGTIYEQTATVSLFFNILIICVKFPEFLSKYGINFKKLVSYMYNPDKNPILKKTLDEYFDHQMHESNEEANPQDPLTRDIAVFAQFFGSLIENYQMSEEENPFANILTVKEMNYIFNPDKPQILGTKDFLLKLAALPVFYNFNLLPKLFITSRSIFKNDLNFSPLHRNFFLSDISVLLDKIKENPGEELLFISLLDNISKFLNEQSAVADIHKEQNFEKIFVFVLYYFIQMVKSFQYYRIANPNILRKIVEYLRTIIITTSNLIHFNIFKDIDNQKNQIQYDINQNDQSNEKKHTENNLKIINNISNKNIPNIQDTSNNNVNFNGTNNNFNVKPANIDPNRKIIEQSLTNKILIKINNQTYLNRKKAVEEAICFIKGGVFDFSSYLNKHISVNGVEYDGSWVINDAAEIAKMILVKFNDIVFHKLLLSQDTSLEETTFCFQNNELTKELILLLFNKDEDIENSFTIENIDIIDMLIHDQDCYINNLIYISQSKFNQIYPLDLIYSIPEFSDEELHIQRNNLINCLNDYLFNILCLEEFEFKLVKTTSNYKKRLQNVFDLESGEGMLMRIKNKNMENKGEIINRQIKLAEKGYFFELLEILMTLVREEIINLSYIDNIYNCIECFLVDNPFLCLSVFSEEVYTTILTNNNIDFYKVSLLFYFKASYILFTYGYKLDLSNFFLTFHMNIIETDNLILEYEINHIINLLLKQILKIRTSKDYTNPMSRVLQILNNFRKKINMSNILRELFIEDSIPCDFLGPLNDDEDTDGEKGKTFKERNSLRIFMKNDALDSDSDESEIILNKAKIQEIKKRNQEKNNNLWLNDNNKNKEKERQKSEVPLLQDKNETGNKQEMNGDDRESPIFNSNNDNNNNDVVPKITKRSRKDSVVFKGYSETLEKTLKNKYQKYPKMRILFQYLVSYYRLVVMLDEEKSAIFEPEELELIIFIMINKEIFPSIQRVFAGVSAKFIIQLFHFDPKKKMKKEALYFVIKNQEIKHAKTISSDVGSNKPKLNKVGLTSAEEDLRKIENMTLYLIQSTYNTYSQFPKTFRKNIKSYLTYFNDCCITPLVFCSFKCNFFRENANYQNKYAFYCIILSFLIAFKIFLNNLENYQDRENLVNEEKLKISGTPRSKLSKHVTDQYFSKKVINKKEDKEKVQKDVKINLNSKGENNPDGITELMNFKSNVFNLIEEYGFYNFTEEDIPEIINNLEKDIKIMQDNEYTEHFELLKTIDIYKFYIKYINIPTVCSPFHDKKKTHFNPKIIEILQIYDKKKSLYNEMAINHVSPKGNPTNNKVKLQILSITESIITRIDSQLDLNRYLYFLFKTKRKLFKIDKKLFQIHTIKTHSNIDFHNNLAIYMNRIFKEKILNQFLSALGSSDSFEYNIFVNIVEFYSFFCLNQNISGQLFLSGTNLTLLNNREITFIDFYLKKASQILKLLNYYNTKNDLICFIETQPKNEYFKRIYSSIINLLRNILMCCYPTIYLNTFRTAFFYTWFSQNNSLINKVSKNYIFVYYLKDFLTFCSTIIEDNPNVTKKYVSLLFDKNIPGQMSPIKYILKKIKPFLLVNALKNIWKRLFEELEASSGVKYDNSSSEMLELYKNKNKIIYDDKFLLCQEIFNFLMNLMCKTEHFNKIQNIMTVQIEKLKSQEFIFFDSIIKAVEIVYKINDEIDDEIMDYINNFSIPSQKRQFDTVISFPRKNEKHCEKHVFRLLPETFYVSFKDYQDLFSVNLENPSEKNTAILELIPHLTPLALTRMKLLQEKSEYNKKLITFNYDNDQSITKIAIYITVIISAVINLILILANMTFAELTNNNSNVLDILFYINMAHMAILFVFIVNWIVYNLIYKVQISRWAVVNGKIPIYFNFVLGIVALCHHKLTFLYSFLLLSCVSISPTMEMVIKAVKTKYNTFLNVLALILIVVWIFSGVGFYYQSDDFANPDLSMNYCDTYFHCLISIFNYGLREGNLDGKVLSIEDNFYYKRFVFEWFFFFMINLILLNAVNGIIVDTFQTFREEGNTHYDQMQNVCYICSLKRGELEMFGISFGKHTNETHYVYNYVDHLLSLQFQKTYKMNFLDYYVVKLYKEDLSSFLPYKESKALNNIKE